MKNGNIKISKEKIQEIYVKEKKSNNGDTFFSSYKKYREYLRKNPGSNLPLSYDLLIKILGGDIKKGGHSGKYVIALLEGSKFKKSTKNRVIIPIKKGGSKKKKITVNKKHIRRSKSGNKKNNIFLSLNGLPAKLRGFIIGCYQKIKHLVVLLKYLECIYFINRIFYIIGKQVTNISNTIVNLGKKVLSNYTDKNLTQVKQNESSVFFNRKAIYNPLLQFDIEGKYLKEWQSTISASKELGIKYRGISNCCRGNTKTYKGFVWKFKNLPIEELSNIIKDDMSGYQRFSNKGKFGKDSKFSKPILQYDLDGNFLKEWFSASEAEKVLSISASGISAVCRFKKKQTGNFQWRYNEAGIEIENKIYKYENTYKHYLGKDNVLSKAVLQFSPENIFIKEWDCLTDVQRELKIPVSSITFCCRGRYKSAGGFIWRYKDK